jgi:arsenite methyltransferase
MSAADQVRKHVRDQYAERARSGGSCCSTSSSCCGAKTEPVDSERLGYDASELGALPEGADMGLGCGNPTAIAALEPGQTVVDLGSGGGIDCFLAARKVGEAGRVIGVDMTPEMIEKARAAADKAGLGNVEFRLGEIEHVPVADTTVDVIMSNCVINLSPDKPAVYRDAYRVLKPGGRLAISDIVALKPLPEELLGDVALLTGCVAGAATIDETERALREAGFDEVRITPLERSRSVIKTMVPSHDLSEYVVSATIVATKH